MVFLELHCGPKLSFYQIEGQMTGENLRRFWQMKASGEVALYSCSEVYLASLHDVYNIEILWSDSHIPNLIKQQQESKNYKNKQTNVAII